MKLLPNDMGGGWKCSLKRRAAAWRMANVDLCNLRYDSAAGYGKPVSELRYDSGRITRGRHAYNHEWANGCNLVVFCVCHFHMLIHQIIYLATTHPA